MSYKELQEELKSTITEIKKVSKNTIPYIKLKRKANEIHLQLIETEKMIKNFK
jgi:uncharacterized protein with ATP-grasp and redox domains